MPRQFIINVVYTLCGDEFENWVKKTILKRNKELIENRDKEIAMDPTIAAIFKSSTSVSVSKGISNYLLKPNAKRRRTKEQVRQDKAKADAKAKEIENKLSMVESMQT